MKIYHVTTPHNQGYYSENSKTLIKLRNRKVLYRKYVDRIHAIRDALLPRFISQYEEGRGYWYYGFSATSKISGSIELCRELDALDKYMKSKLTTWYVIKEINSVTVDEIGILED